MFFVFLRNRYYGHSFLSLSANTVETCAFAHIPLVPDPSLGPPCHTLRHMRLALGGSLTMGLM